jgi:HAE1 family hydrophobic/amphiphilic exporter-1
MNLFHAFISNPVKVSVGVLLVVLFGAISLVMMPKQLTPEVENPVLTVETRWPGASPQEVEREIVQEQEEQLQSVEGLVKMFSECRDSEGRVVLEFVVGTNVEDAMQRVNTRLQQVREYPVDAQEPVIEGSDVSDRPIARFALAARPPSHDQIRTFQKAHPELAENLDSALTAMNTALRVLRLQRVYEELGEEHPELKALLPPEQNLPELRKFAENVLEARLERVPGVADAETSGGQEEELQVVIDPERLAARQLTIADVRNALLLQNQDTSAGDLWEGKRRWVIRTLGQFRTPEQVKRQVLKAGDGAPVYIGDVADVQIGYKKPDSMSRRYGGESVSLSVRRSSGANVLDVMIGLRNAAEQLNNGILESRGLELFQYYDETDYIQAAIGNVQQNIFIGGALTVIVLLLFLHLEWRTLVVTPLIAASSVAAAYVSPWFFVITMLIVIASGFWFGRGALVISLAIPVSIIGTFLCLALLGRSLNVVSLAGLAFAVGMLVDNAIVVLENIYRRHEMGESAVTACVKGTQEVAGAIVSSTLTTVAVFLPVLFVQQMAGQLFRDIALAISAAVGLSLIVAFTMIPTAASRLLGLGKGWVNGNRGLALVSTGPPLEIGSGHTAPVRTQQDAAPARSREEHGGNFFIRRIERACGRITRFVADTNRWIFASRWRSLAVVGVMVGASLAVSVILWPDVEYLPTGNRNFIMVSISPPPGYNMNQLAEIGQKFEEDLRPYWDVDPGTPAAENLDYPMIRYYFYAVRGRDVFLGIMTEDPTRADELAPLIRKIGSQFPGTLTVVRQSSLFESGRTGGRTVDVEITGPELPQLVALGKRIFNDVQRVLPEAQALPRPSLDLSAPEIHVEPKLVESSEMGVSAADLGYTVDALVDGAYAGDYFVGGDKIDLTIVGNASFSGRTQDLDSLPVATGDGQVVPLTSLARVRYGSGPEQINRRERLRTITIQVSPPLTMPLETAMQRIESEIVAPLEAEGLLEGDYLVNISGTADRLREAWEALRWNLVLALIITYLLMAALFESWLYPFVIIFSVPLGAVGGILGLAILNLFVFQSLDVLTMLGFIILIGTVVNNAILIVHQSLNHIRYDAMPPRDAVAESVQNRMRPIFMTTVTTILGLLPLVVFPGQGSELYRGLGAVLLGGLLVSTVFTLFLVPTVFVLMMDAKAWVTGRVASMSPVLGQIDGRAASELDLSEVATSADAPKHRPVRRISTPT